MKNETISSDKIQSMVEFATQLGSSHGFKTDFSTRSIKKIDKYLNELYKEVPNNSDFDDEAISGIALSLGIYMGEILRKKTKNVALTWAYGVPITGGDQTAYLYFQDNEIYPVDWVLKQINDGDVESIAAKFQFFIKRLKAL